MSEDDELLEAARCWIAKADNDLTAAAQILKLGRDCPAETVCFHTQQCIEKYFKVLLVVHRIDFPKTHDLSALASLKPDALLALLDARQRRRMTEYATVIRYPSEEMIGVAEARRAIAAARRVRRAVRRLLPRATLRRKR